MADKKHTLNEIPVEKTMLAKLFAKENISVVHSNVKTAMFDVGTRTMYLPYWENVSLDMYDMLTAHETGHALETPPDGMHENNKVYTGPIRSYLNVVEDARIEKLQLRRYPGLKGPFSNAYQELMLRGFFNSKGEKDITKRDFSMTLLGNRLNLYFKLGRWGHLNVPFFNDEERELLRRCSLVESFDEVRALARDILEYDKRMFQNNMQQPSGEGDENSDDNDDSDQNQKNNNKKGKKSKNSNKNGDDSDSEPSESESDDGDQEDNGGESSGSKKNGKKNSKKKNSSNQSDNGDDDGEDGEENGDQKGDKKNKKNGKDKKDGNEEGEGQGDGEEGDDDGDSAGGDSSDSDGDGGEDGKGKSNKGGSKKGNDKGDASGDGAGSDTDGKNDNKKNRSNASQGGNGFGRNESLTDEQFAKQCADYNQSDKAFQQSMESLVSQKNFQDVLICNLPQVDSSKMILTPAEVIECFENYIRDTKKADYRNYYLSMEESKDIALEVYKNFRQQHLNAVNYLIKEFELRKAADEHKRTLTTKMGDLNLSKIHQYKFTEDIFRRADLISEGKCHAFVMLLDMSSSMTSIYYKTMEQLLILVEFCHRLNIPFEVYGFSDNMTGMATVGRKHGGVTIKPKVNDIVPGNIGRCALYRLIDNSVKDVNYRKLVGYLIAYASGISHRRSKGSEKMLLKKGGKTMPLECTPEFTLSGTPLVEAMYVMPDIIQKFKTKTGAQIVHFFNLTDGMGGALTEFHAMAGQDAKGNFKTITEPIFIYNYYDPSQRRSKLIFNDLKTKKIYEYAFDANQKKEMNNHIQDISMNLLSKRIAALGCNVININLLASADENSIYHPLMRAQNANAFFKKTTPPDEKIKAIYKRDGFAKVESSIFTHEFFMNANISTEDGDFLKKIKGTESAEKMGAAITKAMKETVNSRLLAVEFSKLIAQ